MQPLISIVIPFYNAAAFIERTLFSVYDQTYKNIEVICVDNNSTDSTIEKIKHLKQSRDWNLILLQEPKQGAPHARNLGLKQATGSFVQFLDADDYLVPEKLQKQLNYFSEHSVDFITGEHYENVAGGKRYKKRNFKGSWHGLITGAIGITSSALFKKDILLNVAGFDPTLASNQEKDLYFRLMKNGYRHAQLQEPVFEKNFSNNSISSRTDRQAHLLTKIIFTNTIKRYLKYLATDSEINRLVNTQSFYLFQMLCKYTSMGLRRSIYSYYKNHYEFDIWKSDASMKNKLILTLINPVGYFFIKKGLEDLQTKRKSLLFFKRIHPKPA